MKNFYFDGKIKKRRTKSFLQEIPYGVFLDFHYNWKNHRATTSLVEQITPEGITDI